MKKGNIAAGACGFLLAGMLALPAHAADERSTTVTYTEGNRYMIEIPANVLLSTEKETETSITASEINISPTEQVEVGVKDGVSSGTVELKRAGSTETAASTVSLTKGGSGIQDGEAVAVFKGQATTAAEGGTLYFSPLPGDLKAGTWTGTIVFDISTVTK